MTRLRTIFALILGLVALSCRVHAQRAEEPAPSEIHITPLNPQNGGGLVQALIEQELVVATNGVRVTCGGAVLTAESAEVNMNTGDVSADTHVRILFDDLIWVGEHVRFNFKTRQLEAGQARFGHAPVFVEAQSVYGDITNRIYAVTNGFVTTDDIAQPMVRLQASRIVVIPRKRVIAYNAVLYVEGVPIFYFPYYARNLGPRANNFNFVPGYRSAYGPYLLSSYAWFPDNTTNFDVLAHLDYRVSRGVGLGPDLNFNFGDWGAGTLKYYYAHDLDPAASTGGPTIPAEDRQRVHFSYLADPATNLQVLSMVRYQTDTNFLEDFFENEYRHNPQPSTYLEVDKFWQNFSLDTYAQPRLNNFLETVERLPEVRLTGFRQELGATPFYYESQSSVGYYRRLFPEFNPIPGQTNFEAARADTYHQLVLPTTLFGWLEVEPHVGGRYTYYGEGSGPRTDQEQISRGVFDTGVAFSFKASRLWPDFQSQTLEADGLRHILEPSANYVFVPKPNYQPAQLPQFDQEFAGLRLLPIEFPDYNSIDSVDARNVLRLGLENKLQTKRRGQVVTFLDWNLYTDWRIETQPQQTRFSDVYSDLVFRPRNWLTLESLTRYDVQDGLWRMSYHSATFQPNDRWSWSLGHFYLRDDPVPPPQGLGPGNNLLTSTIFYRLDQNWGLRGYHRFEASDGRMQEQAYSLYRDLRTWTAALTFRVLDNLTGPEDFTVAFTFSLKAFPRFGLGADSVRPYGLLGGF